MGENRVCATDQQQKLHPSLSASSIEQKLPEVSSNVPSALPRPVVLHHISAASPSVGMSLYTLCPGRLGKGFSLDFRLRPAAGKGLGLCVTQEATQAFPLAARSFSQKGTSAGPGQGSPCRSWLVALPNPGLSPFTRLEERTDSSLCTGR